MAQLHLLNRIRDAPRPHSTLHDLARCMGRYPLRERAFQACRQCRRTAMWCMTQQWPLPAACSALAGIGVQLDRNPQLSLCGCSNSMQTSGTIWDLSATGIPKRYAESVSAHWTLWMLYWGGAQDCVRTGYRLLEGSLSLPEPYKLYASNQSLPVNDGRRNTLPVCEGSPDTNCAK